MHRFVALTRAILIIDLEGFSKEDVVTNDTLTFL